MALKNDLFTPVSISDIKDVPTLAALFEVDTNYGRWPEEVKATDKGFVIGGREIPYYDSSKELPDWKALGVDLVVDCTGRATSRPGAQAHLDRGAKRVLVSAPSRTLQDCDAVLLPGINLEQFDPEKHKIVSMASCTTNALAPVVKVVLESFGIKYGLFSTVHAYTNTQSLTDQPMRDRRDSWAAAENIIPASSGAARALQFIWQDLKITGKAYRVPVRTGSIAELNLVTERPVTVDEVNDAFRKAAEQPAAQGRHGCARGRVGLVADRRRPALVDRRPAADRGAGGHAALGRRLVRQRDGLRDPARRDGGAPGGVGAGTSTASARWRTRSARPRAAAPVDASLLGRVWQVATVAESDV